MTLTETLKQKFPQGIAGSHNDYGDETVFVAQEELYSILEFLKNYPQGPFDIFLDLCGVDYLGQEPRFEVVYHLYSLKTHARIRLRCKLAESDLKVPSVIGLWRCADWFEREAYDMFGIHFEGHPNLKRLLMWDEFKGHPLRKDYPVNKRQPIPKPADIV